MNLTDDEAKDLKAWIIKKLEDISDADSDVLADYVLALIRADTPEPDLKANAIENLDDFLRDHTAQFVDEIFFAIHSKSYIPGYAGSPTFTSTALPTPTATGTTPLSIPTGPSKSYAPLGPRANAQPAQNRKRSYNDAHGGGAFGGDFHHGHDGRQMKHMRRGGAGMSNGHRGNFAGNGMQHQSQLPGMSPPSGPQNTQGMHSLPGLPLDQESMSAIFAMGKAIGLSPPAIPQSGSPVNAFPSGGNEQGQATPGGGKTRINARCRDYDTKGYCLRGIACPFNHGDNQVIVPGQPEEYDPKNAGLMDLSPTQSSPVNGHTESFRGRASRGRGDRGGGGGSMRGGRHRAEFSQVGPNHDRSLTTVVVEQIPEENFDDAQVRTFFETFGSVKEVTMQAYKRLALVKFDDYHAARAAYESPKVIFDNRFVKVYWYNPNQASNANGSAGSQTGPKASSPTTPSSATKPETPAFDREKFEREAEAAQKKLDERRALQKANEEKKAELERQREELVKRQEQQKRKLQEILKAKGVEPQPGATNDAESSDSKPKASATTEALRAKVKELEDEAKSMGLDPDQLNADPSNYFSGRGRGHGRGRAAYRGSWDSGRGGHRGRGAYRGAPTRGAGGIYNLDNRPRTVRVEVTAPDDAKDEGLRQFLFSIGEPASITTNPERTVTTVAFRDRFTAEKLFYGTRDIPDVGTVEMAWLPNAPIATNGGSVSNPSTPTAANARTGMTNDKDGDAEMGGAGSAPAPNGEGKREAGRPADEGREVEYDVAEEDDGWIA